MPGGGRQVLLETAQEGLPSLRETVQALTQIRHNSPLWRRGGAEEISEAELDAGLEPINRWIEARDQEAERLNGYLEPSAWGPPPWTANQWQTLRVVMELVGE